MAKKDVENVDMIVEEQIEEVEEVVIDKHEAFQDASVTLVRKAIIAIENVGKASNEKKYEYSEEEVEKMFAALEEVLSDTKHMFKKRKEFKPERSRSGSWRFARSFITLRKRHSRMWT